MSIYLQNKLRYRQKGSRLLHSPFTYYSTRENYIYFLSISNKKLRQAQGQYNEISLYVSLALD